MNGSDHPGGARPRVPTLLGKNSRTSRWGWRLPRQLITQVISHRLRSGKGGWTSPVSGAVVLEMEAQHCHCPLWPWRQIPARASGILLGFWT